MPWYIRFGKVPDITATKPKDARSKSLTVSFSFEIRNDLGDTLYPIPVPISIAINSDAASQGLTRTPLSSQTQWTGRQWMQNIKLPIPSTFADGSRGRIRVELAVDQSFGSNQLLVRHCAHLESIMGTTSAWVRFQAGEKAEPVALRHMPGNLNVWEQTGSSIAAHVWDAGVVLCAHLLYLLHAQKRSEVQETVDSDSPPPPEVLPLPNTVYAEESVDAWELHELAKLLLEDESTRFKGAEKPQMNALELGSGCGITGLVLSQQFPSWNLELTDTPEAQELLERNVKLSLDWGTTTSTPEHGARIPYALDWESRANCATAAHRFGERQLILVTDCTYNVDMIEHLVNALSALAGSRTTLVAVALKRRHEDEERFWVEMSRARFEVVGRHVFDVPASTDERAYGVEPKDIELHLFRRRTADAS